MGKRICDCDFSLDVDFPDKSSDVILLKKVPNEETVFKGTLKEEGTDVSMIVENASNSNIVQVVSSRNRYFISLGIKSYSVYRIYTFFNFS